MTSWATALTGGVLIGTAATVLLWLNGRTAGISGIVNGALFPLDGERTWRVVFLAALIVSAGLYLVYVPSAPLPRSDYPRAALVVAGLLVGFGTRMGNGCTSGHGVCGLGRRSLRSLAAVVMFMAFGMLTTFVVRHFWGAA